MSRNLSVPTSDVVFTIDAATIDVMIQQIEPDGIRGVPGLIAMKRGLPEVPAPPGT